MLSSTLTRALHRVAHHPVLTLTTGVVLIGTSGYQTWTTWSDMQPGAHHGVLLFGIVHTLQALPNLLDGAGALDEALDEGGEAG